MGRTFYKYSLNVSWEKLSEKECKMVSIVYSMVTCDFTYRIVEEYYGIPITTLWFWIHRKLNGISPKLYEDACNMFKRHKPRKGL